MDLCHSEQLDFDACGLSGSGSDKGHTVHPSISRIARFQHCLGVHVVTFEADNLSCGEGCNDLWWSMPVAKKFTISTMAPSSFSIALRLSSSAVPSAKIACQSAPTSEIFPREREPAYGSADNRNDPSDTRTAVSHFSDGRELRRQRANIA